MPIIRFSGVLDSISLLNIYLFVKQNGLLFPLSGMNKDYLYFYDSLRQVLLTIELQKLFISIVSRILE